jgi:hypothetical protein
MTENAARLVADQDAVRATLVTVGAAGRREDHPSALGAGRQVAEVGHGSQGRSRNVTLRTP